MTATAVKPATRAKAKQVEEQAIDPMARIGLATQGVLYLIVGVLAIRVAQGHGGDQADTHGAIASVARQPFGRFLLVVLAFGLALHALWRITLVWRDDGAKRLLNAGRALIYASLTYAAVRTLLHSSPGGSGTHEQHATATVLGWPGGRLLVILVGLGIIASGVWQWRQPFTRKFAKRLRTYKVGSAGEKAVEVVGSAGYTARGAVLALVGAFLVRAAVQYDPSEANGIDGALKKLAAASYGTWLLVAVAIGLFLFGGFRIIDAWLRTPAET
jgi:hypothetical protein